MRLIHLKEFAESLPDNAVLNRGISRPFSWRGSYDEVAFAILDEPQTKEEFLEHIEEALTSLFTGYKGGEYKYNLGTDVNFEQDYKSYSDKDYLCTKLFK